MSFKIFIHGLDSTNQGTKSIFFRERYPDMIIPHFRGSLQRRMEVLEEILLGKSGIRMVGSSFGGLMATIFTMEHESRVDRITLLAPAIHRLEDEDYPGKGISVPVSVYHGSNDEVIPLGEVECVARKRFSDLSFHVVDDDHFLHNTFRTIDWDGFLLTG